MRQHASPDVPCWNLSGFGPAMKLLFHKDAAHSWSHGKLQGMQQNQQIDIFYLWLTRIGVP